MRLTDVTRPATREVYTEGCRRPGRRTELVRDWWHWMVRPGLFLLLLTPGALWAGAYSNMTDAELSQLASDWESMSQEDRRALLTEIRTRMSTASDDRPIIQIKTERRYGRIIQRPDGSVLHIETREQVVQYRQAAPEGSGFGVGFEQRVAEMESDTEGLADEDSSKPPRLKPQEPAEAPESLPVIRAGNESSR